MTIATQQQRFLIHYTEVTMMSARTVSFILALSSESHNNETTVLATSDAANLCVKGGTDDLVADGYEPLKDLIEDFVENGGKIWICLVCARTKGITERDLRPGVEIAGAPRTMDFMARRAQVLM